MIEPNERCGTCRFFQKWPGNSPGLQWGYCRRFPPTVVIVEAAATDEAGTSWPNEFAQTTPDVSETQWCGEWKQA